MKGCIVIFFLCAAFTLCGQVEITAPAQTPYDSTRAKYVKSFPDHFFLWPLLKQRQLNFDLQDIPDHKNRLVYKSNKPYSLGVGMYIFEVVLELTVSVPLDKKNEAIYGASDASDIQVNIFGKQWGVDMYRQKYEGFYIDDRSVEIPPGQPYPQRPDITTHNTGITGSYVFNHKKLSFRAAYNYADQQLRSAGSLMAFVSFGSFKTEGDSALLGDKYAAVFGTNANIKEFNSTSLSIAPGYTYTLIHKGFFLNGAVAVGPANNWLYYRTEDGKFKNDVEFTPAFVARVGIGYNGERFFGGLNFSTQGGTTKYETVRLSSSRGTFKVLVGYRFKEFGFLKKRLIDLPKALGLG